MTAADAARGEARPPDRVLVLAPFRSDAAVLKDLLREYGIVAGVCAESGDLGRELAGEAAPLVISQEAMTPAILGELAGYLTTQPNWSELPVVLLLDSNQQSPAVLAGLRRQLPTAKLTVLQKPVRTIELVTAVQTAVAARRRQLQLRDHMIWQEELQREFGHRVQNVLANVSAIYHMSIRQSSSMEDFAASFEGRLSALSRVHRELVVSSEPTSVLEIAGLVLAPYRSESAERIEIRGPPISLVSQSAVTFALCLHELATNAAKYGALSVPDGSVSLAWCLQDTESDPKVSFCWTETGGPPAEPPSHGGYGTSSSGRRSKAEWPGASTSIFGARA